jgi:3-hydroxyisobutyrate dehydrogenase
MLGPITDGAFLEDKSRGSQAMGVLGSGALADWLCERLTSSNKRTIRLLPPSERLQKHTSRRHLSYVATAADLATECQIIFNCVEDDAILSEMLLGTQDRAGIGAEAQPGSIVIDCALKTPRELQAMLGLLGTRGVSVIDLAFVQIDSGVAVLLSGFPDAVEQALPLTEHLGAVTTCGALGNAHVRAAFDGVTGHALSSLKDEFNHLSTALGIGDHQLQVRDRKAPFASQARCADVVHRVLTERGTDPSDLAQLSRFISSSVAPVEPLHIRLPRFSR